MSSPVKNQKDAAIGIWRSLSLLDDDARAISSEVAGAVIALAEEQRTANLIAFLGLLDDPTQSPGLMAAISVRLGLKETS